MKMLQKNSILVVFHFVFLIGFSQSNTYFLKKADTLNKKRRNTVYITQVVGASTALVGLNQLWYANYPKSDFHFKNDNNDWLQMDKFGHIFSAYYMGKLSIKSLKWAGENKKNQLLYGGTFGFLFLTSVEVLDGFSKQWGFSTGDMVANATGTGLLIGQELLWDEQRIYLKYSFHNTQHSNLRPNVLGKTLPERLLKNYNGQTYWLSANIWSFKKDSNFPKWLNIALGYGANGMLTGNKNTPIPNLTANNIEPYRQFYLSLDVDFTKIKTQSKFLKTLFNFINFIKIPAPTVEINTQSKLKLHILHF